MRRGLGIFPLIGGKIGESGGRGRSATGTKLLKLMVRSGCLVDLPLSELRFGQHQVSLRGLRIDGQPCARLFFARGKISGKGTDKRQVQPRPHALGDNRNSLLRRFQRLRRVAQLRIAAGQVLLTDAIGGEVSDKLRVILNTVLPVARDQE